MAAITTMLAITFAEVRVIETRRVKTWLPLLFILGLLLAGTIPQARAGNTGWTSGGPEGGLTRAIMASPNIAYDGTVFAAAQNRGVLKSTDRGATWTVSNIGMGNADVRSLAISPAYATDRTLYAASLGAGVFRSRDGGQSWASINNGLTTSLVWAVALSPQFPADHTLFAATDDNGVFRSIDGGDTWVRASTGLTVTSFLAIAVSPDFANDRTVLAGAQGGVFKSTDGGLTWSWAGNGINRIDIRSIVFSPAFAVDGVAFVGTERGGVFKTTNRGQSWFDPSGGRGPGDISGMAISPNYAADQTLYVSNDTYGYSVSRDGGATWASHLSLAPYFPLSTNVDGISIALSPNYATDGTIWFGSFGTGIYRSQDFGTSWQLVRSGYYAARTDRVVVSGSYEADHAVFALALGGGFYGSSDAGQTWRTINGPLYQRLDFGLVLAAATSPNYATDRTLFVSRVGPNSILRSRNGGESWERADTGIPSNDIVSLAVSPAFANDHIVFASSLSQGVFRSTNDGDQWVAVNSGLTSLRTTQVVLSPAFANDHTVYVSTDGGGIFKSTNGGNSWQPVNSGLTNLGVRDLALSPNYPADQTLFACTSVGVFRSLNGGASWTLVRSGYNFRAVAVSPRFSEDGTVYVGGSYGVLRSTDRGTTWADLSASLGHINVSDLAIGREQTGHTVFASTIGGGVWQYTVGGAPLPATSTPTITPPPMATPTRTPTRTPTPAVWLTPTRTPMPPGSAYRLNCGGPEYIDTRGRLWLADQPYLPGSFGYISGVRTYTVTEPIANTLDDVLYQSERFDFPGYRFDLPNGEYQVELLFAEIWTPKPDGRIFDVKIQEQTVLSDFNILRTAGGRLIALRYVFPAIVTDGQLLVTFVAKAGAPKINAIGVEPLSIPGFPTSTSTSSPTPTSSPVVTPSATSTRTPSPTATVTPIGSTGIRVNCGGGSYRAGDGSVWQADQEYRSGGWGYIGGKTYSSVVPIAGTEDDPLYHSERWGMSGYRFDLTPGTYVVQLKFAEVYGWKAGQRVFDVQIEGQTVLANLDIFAAVGRYTAYDRSFTVQVTDGSLDITFTPHLNAPKINAIRVTSVQPP